MTRGAVAAMLALALTPATALAGLTPPAPASPNAEDSQIAYIVMVVLGTVIALTMIGALIAAVRGRGAEPDASGEARRTRGTDAAQRRVGVALSGLVLAVFIFGIVMTESARQVEATGSDGLTTAQKDLELPGGDAKPLEIEVSGQQWLWRYEYPDGTFSYYEMVVPVDTEVVLDIESTDLLHRWWVPALGGMFDAVPGQGNQTWFKADEVGEYEGRSTQFSGPAYAQMRALVRVVEPTEYEAWLEEQAADIEDAQERVAQQVLDGDIPGMAGSNISASSETEIGAGDPAGVGEGSAGMEEAETEAAE